MSPTDVPVGFGPFREVKALDWGQQSPGPAVGLVGLFVMKHMIKSEPGAAPPSM